MKIEMECTPQKSARPLERKMAKFVNVIMLLGMLQEVQNFPTDSMAVSCSY